jgi:hypothetical protein
LQIVAQEQHSDLANVVAITFLPPRPDNSFHGNLLHRVGKIILVTLSYDPNPDRPGRFSMPFRGIRGQVNTDGTVCSGSDGGCRFHYDAAISPKHGDSKGALTAFRQPALVDLALRMDRFCKRRLEGCHRPLLVPQLPRILLGFAPNQPPAFEDSPALRRLAACKLEIPLERLGSNGPVLLDRLLKDFWQRELILPDSPANATGNVLVDARLCTQTGKALGMYEDFSALVGLHVWNPVRGVQLLETQNPARDVLRAHGIDSTKNFDQVFPDELIARLETAMRMAIGATHHLLTRVEVLDGLTSPENPIVAYAASLPKLRRRLSSDLIECTTDDDLLRAARHPDGPLVASGACRVQVVSNHGLPIRASHDFLCARESKEVYDECELEEA